MARGGQTWIGPAIGLAVGALVVGVLSVRHVRIQQQRIGDARAFTVDGPPCPQISEAELLAAPGRGLRSFDYGEVTFARQKGEAECATVRLDGGRSDSSYPVCTFDRPGDLRIRSARGEWRFRPGPGRPATVSARDGVARCVLVAAKVGA